MCRSELRRGSNHINIWIWLRLSFLPLAHNCGAAVWEGWLADCETSCAIATAASASWMGITEVGQRTVCLHVAPWVHVCMLFWGHAARRGVLRRLWNLLSIFCPGTGTIHSHHTAPLSLPGSLSVSDSLKYERKKIHSREGKEEKNRTGLVERGCEVKVNGAFRDRFEDVNLMITCISEHYSPLKVLGVAFWAVTWLIRRSVAPV